MSFLIIFVFGLKTFASAEYPFSRSEEAETGRSYYPSAPLHYVKIGNKLDGDYKFGYDTGRGPLGQSFREEVRLADGTVTGTYGLVDELGHKRVVRYSAGKGGFVAKEDKSINNTTRPAAAPTSYRRSKKIITKTPVKTISQKYNSQSVPLKPNKLSLRPTPGLVRRPAPVQNRKTPPVQNRKTPPVQNRKTQSPMLQMNKNSLYKDKSTTPRTEIYRSPESFYHDKANSRSIEIYRMSKSSEEESRPASLKEYRVQKSAGYEKPDFSSKESYASYKPLLEDDILHSLEELYKIAGTSPSSSESTESPTEKQVDEYKQKSAKSNIDVYTNFPLHRNHFKTPIKAYEEPAPLYKERFQTSFMKTYDSSIGLRNAKSNTQILLKELPVSNKRDYVDKIEDEYYDDSPIYIDIERLSYNIGTGKASTEY